MMAQMPQKKCDAWIVSAWRSNHGKDKVTVIVRKTKNIFLYSLIYRKNK